MKIHKILSEDVVTHKDLSKSFQRNEWIHYFEREHSLSAVHMH